MPIGAIVAAAGKITGGITGVISKRQDIKLQKKNQQHEITMAVLNSKTQKPPEKEKSSDKTILIIALAVGALVLVGGIILIIKSRK